MISKARTSTALMIGTAMLAVMGSVAAMSATDTGWAEAPSAPTFGSAQ